MNHSLDQNKSLSTVYFILLILLQLLSTSSLSQVNKVISEPPLGYLQQKSNWVDSVFSTLTPKERIAQLILMAVYSNKDEDHVKEISALVRDYKIGGLIVMQGGPIRQARLSNQFQAAAKVPLLISITAEWGLGMRLDSTLSLPYQMALGAVQDNSLIYKMGAEVARQCKLMGIHLNFAPVVDINTNPQNPVISYRSFGEDRDNVASKSYAYMKGLQDNGILANAKHFPGHGDTNYDSHITLPVINHSLERLDSLELYPFKYLINKGVGSVMTAHLKIPALDPTKDLASSLSKPIVTDLLQERLGFKGLIVTDALNMKGVSNYFPPGILDVKALIAGNDLLLHYANVPTAISEIRKAIDSGEIGQKEIDDRCKKVLAAKQWAGLDHYQPIEIDNLVEDLNRPKANLLNNQLIEASLTLLRNQNNIIPIQGLETLKIASVSIGAKAPTPFQNMLGKYTMVDHFVLPKDGSTVDIINLKEKLRSYNLIIAGLHQVHNRPENNLGLPDDIISFIKELAVSGKSIISVFRNPYIMAAINNLENARGLVMAYQDNKSTQELAAQLIFGGVGAHGKLPVTINNFFKLGDGIEIEKGIRFKYTIPEELKIDSKRLQDRIDSIAYEAINSKAVPGCQVLIAKDRKIIFHKAYGYHKYDSITSVNIDDIYDFASVTKMTGPLPALMKLHDEGKFNLDAELKDYWPEFKRSNKARIDFRHILAHHGRLKAWIPYWRNTVNKNGEFKTRTFKPDSSENYPVKVANNLYLHKNYRKKIIKAIKRSPLHDEEDYLYSGLSFYLYPSIIEKMTSKDYEQYLKETFYRPLGAYSLTYNAYKHFPLERIVPTEKDTFFRMEQLHGWVHDEGAAMMGGISGNAGLFGSANDLAKLMQMYMQMGVYANKRYISMPTLTKFTTCQFCEEGNRRGLGFDKPMIGDNGGGPTAVNASSRSFGHTGYTGTMAWADPEHNLLFIFFSNRVYPTRLNTRLYQLNIRSRIHQIIYDEMLK